MKPSSNYVGATEAARLAGISYRQLDYWVTKRLVIPSVPARGTGTRRLFSQDDLSRLVLLASLRKSGYELEALRKFISEPALASVA